jgi:acetoin utilization protein AcuC
MSTVPTTSSCPPVDLVIVHDDAYAGWVFHTTHPTQGRRFVHGRDRITAAAQAAGLSVRELSPRPASRDELGLVHSEEYLNAVLDEHTCGEWAGPRPDLAALAVRFAGGTLVAMDALLSGRAMTAVHLPGAKHHAQADRSSGFCVLADFALAATLATQSGLRVAVLDLDAHHGDGTEALTADNPGVCTVSIHQAGIFPGTGLSSDPARRAYNLPLDAGAGDIGLLMAVQEALRFMKRVEPDLILLAAGADGHVDDPLSSLGYSTIGYRAAARFVREAFPTVPMLIGGAGGYRPDDATPEVWAAFALEIAAGSRRLATEDGTSRDASLAAVPVQSGMSVAALTQQMQTIIRRDANKAKAPDLAAALHDVLPGLSVTDKVGMFGAEELWLMVGEERVGALASNHLWLAPGHMALVTAQLAGQLLPLGDSPPRWKGWVRVKLADSRDGAAPRRHRRTPLCPQHNIALPATGVCDDCGDRAA